MDEELIDKIDRLNLILKQAMPDNLDSSFSQNFEIVSVKSSTASFYKLDSIPMNESIVFEHLSEQKSEVEDFEEKIESLLLELDRANMVIQDFFSQQLRKICVKSEKKILDDKETIFQRKNEKNLKNEKIIENFLKETEELKNVYMSKLKEFEEFSGLLYEKNQKLELKELNFEKSNCKGIIPEDLEMKIAILESIIEANNSEKFYLKNNSETVNSRKNVLENSISIKKSQNFTNTSNISSKNTELQISDLKTSLLSLNKNFETLKSKYSEADKIFQQNFEVELSTMNEKIQSIKKDFEKFIIEKISLEERLKSKEKELVLTKKKLNDRDLDFHEKNKAVFQKNKIIKNLEEKVLGLSQEKENFRQIIFNAQNEINKIQEMTSGNLALSNDKEEKLSNVIRGLENEKKSLETDNLNLKNAYKSLETSYYYLENSYKNLENSYKNLENSNKNLENSNKNLENFYKNLENEKKNLEITNLSLGKNYETLEKHYRTLENSSKTLKNEKKTLEIAYQSLENAHHNLENEEKCLKIQKSNYEHVIFEQVEKINHLENSLNEYSEEINLLRKEFQLIENNRVADCSKTDSNLLNEITNLRAQLSESKEIQQHIKNSLIEANENSQKQNFKYNQLLESYNKANQNREEYEKTINKDLASQHYLANAFKEVFKNYQTLVYHLQEKILTYEQTNPEFKDFCLNICGICGGVREPDERQCNGCYWHNWIQELIDEKPKKRIN